MCKVLDAGYVYASFRSQSIQARTLGWMSKADVLNPSSHFIPCVFAIVKETECCGRKSELIEATDSPRLKSNLESANLVTLNDLLICRQQCAAALPQT